MLTKRVWLELRENQGHCGCSALHRLYLCPKFLLIGRDVPDMSGGWSGTEPQNDRTLSGSYVSVTASWPNFAPMAMATTFGPGRRFHSFRWAVALLIMGSYSCIWIYMLRRSWWDRNSISIKPCCVHLFTEEDSLLAVIVDDNLFKKRLLFTCSQSDVSINILYHISIIMLLIYLQSQHSKGFPKHQISGLFEWLRSLPQGEWDQSRTPQLVVPW